MREYLDALEQAAAAEAKSEAKRDDDMPPGNLASEPQVTSLTDPTAAWTSKGCSKLAFACGTNYLIDNKLAIIVDVEATPARWQAEVAATKTMLERTKERFGLHPGRLTADAAYGSGLMIGWLMRRGIEPPACHCLTRMIVHNVAFSMAARAGWSAFLAPYVWLCAALSWPGRI